MSANAIEELTAKKSPSSHARLHSIMLDPTDQIRSQFWKYGRMPILEPTMYSKILDFEQSMKKDKMRFYD